jgi:hypothetical protein
VFLPISLDLNKIFALPVAFVSKKIDEGLGSGEERDLVEGGRRDLEMVRKRQGQTRGRRDMSADGLEGDSLRGRGGAVAGKEQDEGWAARIGGEGRKQRGRKGGREVHTTSCFNLSNTFLVFKVVSQISVFIFSVLFPCSRPLTIKAVKKLFANSLSGANVSALYSPLEL